MNPFRRFVTRMFPGCLLLFALGFFFNAGIARSQAVPATLQIIKIDSSAFPEVKVQILVLGPGGLESAAPTRESLSLSENNQSVEYEIEQREMGAEIGFVMDAGTGLYSGSATGATRLQEMKDAISELTQDPLLLTGKDIFYIIAQEPNGSQVLVNPETPATQIPNILSQYNPPITYSYSNPLGGVSALLDFYAKENSAGVGRAQAIVVFSGNMAVDKKYPMASVVAKAKAMGIRVHTVQVRHAEAQQETLAQLAEETGGRFFYYTAEGPVSIAGLKPLLTGIRTQYILTYRSPNPESGTRVVAVGLQYGQNEKPALSQYEVTVQPPVAVIRSPGEDQTVSPQSYVPTEDPQATPATGIVVTASVSWPDSHPRKIKQATLLVNGDPQSVLSEPSDELTFVWNPTKETPEGPVTLQIQIEDELGLVGLSDQIVVRIKAASTAPDPLRPLPEHHPGDPRLPARGRRGRAGGGFPQAGGGHRPAGGWRRDRVHPGSRGDPAVQGRARRRRVEGDAGGYGRQYRHRPLLLRSFRNHLDGTVEETRGPGLPGQPGRQPDQPPALHHPRGGRRLFPARRPERERHVSERGAPGSDGPQSAQGRR